MGLGWGLSLCISHMLPDGENLLIQAVFVWGGLRLGTQGSGRQVQRQVQLRWDQEQVKGPIMAPMDCVVGGIGATCVGAAGGAR